VLVSDSYQLYDRLLIQHHFPLPFMSFHQHSGSQSKTLELSCFSQFANSCLLQNQLSSHFWFHILLASSFHLRSYLCDHHQ